MKSAILTGSALLGSRTATQAAASELKRLLRVYPHALCVAVDGGLSIWTAARATPSLWVGDGDSCKPAQYKKIAEQMLLPCEKDRSDLAEALQVCADRHIQRVHLIGFEGARVDHDYAVSLECSRIAHRFERLESFSRFWVGAGRDWRGTLKKNQLVSLFSLTGPAHGVTLQGFQYSLQAEALEAGSRGLSNVAQGGECCVSVNEGSIMGILS